MTHTHTAQLDCCIFCGALFSCIAMTAGQYFVNHHRAKPRPRRAVISLKDQEQTAEEVHRAFTSSSKALGDRMRSDSKNSVLPMKIANPSAPRAEKTECDERPSCVVDNNTSDGSETLQGNVTQRTECRKNVAHVLFATFVHNVASRLTTFQASHSCCNFGVSFCATACGPHVIG